MQLLKAHDLTEQSRAVFAASAHRGCSLINEDLCAVCTISVSACMRRVSFSSLLTLSAGSQCVLLL